jgi:DNA-directed RNA polymerase alpha subunit
MPKRLTPSELLRLWYKAPCGDDQRIIWFGNAIADHLLDANKPTHRRTPIDRLGLDSATYNPLRRAGYDWIEQLENLSVSELRIIRMIGADRAVEIRQRIDAWRTKAA